MISRKDKTEIIEGLAERLGRQRIVIFTDIRGISVAALTRFRRELRHIGAELKVVKKTLLRRALDAAGPAFSGSIEPKRELDGEVAAIFGYEDQAAPAKAAAKFGKENKTFRFLKGVLGGKVLEADDIRALAKLPGRPELLGAVARALNAPLQGLVNVLQGNIRGLVVVLSQMSNKKM